jgi:hypothetical protein
MIIVYIKIEKEDSFILELEDNYTISSREFLVKIFAKLQLKNFDFFTKSYGLIGSKVIVFEKNNYFNTSIFNSKTLYLTFSKFFELNESMIQEINNILDNYY